jgi:hypothetical protein
MRVLLFAVLAHSRSLLASRLLLFGLRICHLLLLGLLTFCLLLLLKCVSITVTQSPYSGYDDNWVQVQSSWNASEFPEGAQPVWWLPGKNPQVCDVSLTTCLINWLHYTKQHASTLIILHHLSL